MLVFQMSDCVSKEWKITNENKQKANHQIYPKKTLILHVWRNINLTCVSQIVLRFAKKLKFVIKSQKFHYELKIMILEAVNQFVVYFSSTFNKNVLDIRSWKRHNKNQHLSNKKFPYSIKINLNIPSMFIFVSHF